MSLLGSAPLRRGSSVEEGSTWTFIDWVRKLASGLAGLEPRDKGHLWAAERSDGGVTRVKLEQASKVTMRMSTLLPIGEDSYERGKQSIRAPARSAGVVSTARRKGGPWLEGETRCGRG